MTTTTQTREVDPDLLNAFIGQMVGDLGATVSAGLVLIGDRLGIYRAMADGTPVTAETLADRTGLAVAYLRPWLANQAAGGYVTHTHVDDDDGDGEEGTDRYALSPEQAAALADPDSPAYFAPSMQVAVGALRDVDAIAERFRTGDGFGWHEHDAGLFVGTERFFKPGYVANLVDTWLPALHGVVPKLQAGARVADVGCGHAASTVLMAAAYPRSTFVGADYHEGSIVVARRRAEEAGVTDNTTFVTVDALDLAGDGYDLVTMFDCLHDMGDPVGAARRIRASLTPDGVFMLVEPRAGDHVEDNLNPLGRVFYGASTLICTPSSLAQPGQAAIGTQAGPATITTVLHQAGFRTVRIAAETPVNHVYEARD
jgi:2-polyprenyl-3-methyl-5-hydroxy-6-metoxy-1,4-benzoquinol methylase